MASPESATEVEAVIQRLVAMAERRPDVCALALVGSWARGGVRVLYDPDGALANLLAACA